MVAVANDVDECAILKGARMPVGADECRIDRHRSCKTAIDCTTGAPLDVKTPCLDEAVPVAGTTIIEIDSMDHSVPVERERIRDGFEQWIWAIAHVGPTELRRDPSRDHWKVRGVDLRTDWGEVAAEMRIIRNPIDLLGFQGLG